MACLGSTGALFLAVVWLLCDLGKTIEIDGTIVNGSRVASPLEKFSFFALPTSGEGSDTWLGCGASVISPTFALSSAHCFGGGDAPCSSPKRVAVWVGDLELHGNEIREREHSGSKSFRVAAEVVCHSSFDGKCSHGHDVALLKFAEPVPDWVKPVQLNLDGAGKEQMNALVTVVGFGLTETRDDVQLITATSPSRMRQAKVSVLNGDGKECDTVYAGGWGCSDPASEGSATHKAQQLCAGSKVNAKTTYDTCAGDSGSAALDVNGVQVGIVSYGGGPGEKREGPGRMCGDPNYPGIYARVSAFADYIKEQVPDLPSSSQKLVQEDGGQTMLIRRASTVKAHTI